MLETSRKPLESLKGCPPVRKKSYEMIMRHQNTAWPFNKYRYVIQCTFEVVCLNNHVHPQLMTWNLFLQFVKTTAL